MEAKVFVEELRKLMPKTKALKSLGLEDTFINYFQNRFLCKPKKLNANYNYSIVTDEVESLVSQYDCSSIEIGMLNFILSPDYSEDYIVVGQIEGDQVVINLITKEVEVRDGMSMDHVIWSCASNGSNFLTSLILSAEYFVRVAILNNIDVEGKIQVLDRVVQAAGGEKYRDFYITFIG